MNTVESMVAQAATSKEKNLIVRRATQLVQSQLNEEASGPQSSQTARLLSMCSEITALLDRGEVDGTQYLSMLAEIEEDFGLEDLDAEEEAAATVEVGPATLEAEAQVPAATVGIEDPELPHPATMEVWPGSLEEEVPAATAAPPAAVEAGVQEEEVVEDKLPATPDDYDPRTVTHDSESWTEGSTDLEPHTLARPPLPP